MNPVNIRTINNWNELKGKLKQEFESITDHDLLKVMGKEEVLVGRLQIKSGKKREEIIDIINKIQSSMYN